MDKDFLIYQIKSFLQPRFRDLVDFKFSIFNPLFWILLLVLFLISLRFWGVKKSRSFCTTITILLLLFSRVEPFIARTVVKYGGKFDPFYDRLFFVILLGIVLLYYAFMRYEQ